jgi:dihydrofolate reductase
MGRLVVTEFLSVDGVFEDPGGAEGYEHGGWTFEYARGRDGDDFKLNELMEAQVQLLGRVTYEGFAEAWPSRPGPFADKLNSDPKYVVSTTLAEPEWQNTTVISSSIPTPSPSSRRRPTAWCSCQAAALWWERCWGRTWSTSYG